MKANSRKCLTSCCTIFIILILILVVTLLILYFTILKPKQPEVIATPVKLQNFQFSPLHVPTLQVTIGIDIFVKNRNYAGFKYRNTSTSVYYRGTFVAWAPIPAGKIRARATQNISTVIDIHMLRVLSNPDFAQDMLSGMVNLTSRSNMEGDVIVLKIFKLHARTSVKCDITVFVWSETSSANCVETIMM